MLLSIAVVSNKVNDKGEFSHTLDRCLSYEAFSNECNEEKRRQRNDAPESQETWGGFRE